MYLRQSANSLFFSIKGLQHFTGLQRTTKRKKKKMQVVSVKVADIRPTYKDLREWMAEPTNLYIGRGHIVFIDGVRFPPEDSPFANPFKIGRDGTRDEVISLYRTWLCDGISDGRIDITLLHGKTNLGCWCKPEYCHGDVLLEVFEELEHFC